jgi:multidrug efflux pump subunit AcrB
MIMLALVLFGGIALGRLGISQFPDVDFPSLAVAVTYEGASPEGVESDVVEPLEEALVQVEGIETITSSAREGRA